ncbi:MAG: hypothetical protein ACI8T1_003179 [Verrucomicrobiales bacterium]|jgi:hypothetical protein
MKKGEKCTFICLEPYEYQPLFDPNSFVAYE